MRQRRHPAGFHIERSTATRMGVAEYPCACRRCKGSRVLPLSTLSRHHRRFGRDPYLPHPVLRVDGTESGFTKQSGFKQLGHRAGERDLDGGQRRGLGEADGV